MINIKKHVKGLLLLAILLPVFHIECFGSCKNSIVINKANDLGDKTIDLLQNEEAWCSEESGDFEESWYSSIMTALNTFNESSVMNYTLIGSPVVNFSTYSTPVRKYENYEYNTPGQRTPDNQPICNCNSSDQGVSPESQSIDDASYLTPARKHGNDEFNTLGLHTPNNKRYKTSQSSIIFNSSDQGVSPESQSIDDDLLLISEIQGIGDFTPLPPSI